MRFLIVMVALVLGVGAAAQDLQRIAAVVNDDVISARDVDRRAVLLAASTGQNPADPAVRRRATEFALRGLIDERLQIQEARRRGITVSEEDIARGFATIARQNNMTPEQFEGVLGNVGLTARDFDSQLRAELSWSRLVRSRLLPTIIISDEEVNAQVDRLRASVGQTEEQVAEILIAVDNPDNEGEARRNAEEIYGQLRNGAPFPVIARQFSQGATAAAGGDLGWVLRGELPDEVAAAVAKLTPGEISEPIRAPSGFYIVRLNARRQVAGGDPNQITVDLKQIVFPRQGDDEGQMELAREVAGTVQGCSDVEAVAREVGAAEGGSLGSLKLGDLPPRFRDAVISLRPGQASQPVASDRSIHVFVVCGRTEPDDGISAQQVRQNILLRRADLMARRYLRDLRRDAVIELR